MSYLLSCPSSNRPPLPMASWLEEEHKPLIRSPFSGSPQLTSSSRNSWRKTMEMVCWVRCCMSPVVWTHTHYTSLHMCCEEDSTCQSFGEFDSFAICCITLRSLLTYWYSDVCRFPMVDTQSWLRWPANTVTVVGSY